MNRKKLNVLLKLEGKKFEMYKVVSTYKGIDTGTDLFYHLLAEEFKKIKGGIP